MENSLSISIQCQSKGMQQNKLTSNRQTSSFGRLKNHLRRSRCIRKRYTRKTEQKLSHTIVGRLHNPPLLLMTDFNITVNISRFSVTKCLYHRISSPQKPKMTITAKQIPWRVSLELTFNTRLRSLTYGARKKFWLIRIF